MIKTVSEGKGRLFRRKDGKYLIYVPKDLAEDSQFPFTEFLKTKRDVDSIPLKIRIEHDRLIAEPLAE